MTERTTPSTPAKNTVKWWKKAETEQELITMLLDHGTPAVLAGLVGRIMGAKSSRRQRVLRPCPKCGVLCGARELKYDHPSVCIASARQEAGL